MENELSLLILQHLMQKEYQFGNNISLFLENVISSIPNCTISFNLRSTDTTELVKFEKISIGN